VPAGLSGLGDVVKSPIYATGVGLALYGARGQTGAQSGDLGDGSFARRLGRRVRGWLAEVL
jgi:cell division protein FtsA